MRHLVIDGALAAMVLGTIISVSALLERQGSAMMASLARHGLDQVLIGEIQLSSPGGSPPSGGLAQDRLLSASSWQRLQQHPAVEQVEAIERLPGMQLQTQGAPRGLDLDVLVLHPRLLAQWQGGSTPAVKALVDGHLVSDAIKVPGLEKTNGAKVRLDLQPPLKAVLSPDAPPMLLPLHRERLDLPQGTAFLQAGAYLRQDHPELQRSGLFSPPWLWIRLRAGEDREAFMRWVNAELAKPGRLALQGASLTMQPLAAHQAVNPASLARWQLWSQAGISLLAWLLMGALALWRWSALRRELALRRAMGQSVAQACLCVLQGPGLAMAVGALAGVGAALAWGGAHLSLESGLLAAAWGVCALFAGAALVIWPAWRVAARPHEWRSALGMGT